jgi:predicted  nucleic acid-binding Zn-ribbon protein
MTETAKLLRLFRVDQQLRGLRTRLDMAEKYLAEQERQLKDLQQRQVQTASDLKKLKTAISSDEGEVAGVDERIAKIREQMNAAKTNKEYSAFLAELSHLKARKEEIERHELEEMTKVEALEKQLAELTGHLAQRQTIVAQAKTERDAREAEIRDRLKELSAQRDALRAEIAASTAKAFEDMVRLHGDLAMAAVEVLDRRNHEWTCGACQMTLPVETINHISAGRLTRCVSCRCFLYTEEEDIVSKKEPKPAKTPKPRVSKAKGKDKAPAVAPGEAEV